jgi:hypothetical protein
MLRTTTLALFGLSAAVVLSLGATTGAAPVPKHLMKEPEGDKAKLQGKWKVESIRMGDQDLGGLLGGNFEMVIEFQGETFTAAANIAGMHQKSTAIVKYGTDGKKQLSMTNTQTVDATGKPVNNGGQKDESFGYALDGGKLILASPANGEKRIVDPLKPGPKDIVIVLARVK